MGDLLVESINIMEGWRISSGGDLYLHRFQSPDYIPLLALFTDHVDGLYLNEFSLHGFTGAENLFKIVPFNDRGEMRVNLLDIEETQWTNLDGLALITPDEVSPISVIIKNNPELAN